MKKLAALLLCLILLCSLIPSAMAANSGKCGANVSWNLSGGTLYIFGVGAMNDYSVGTAPWYAGRGSVKSVVVSESVTRVGSYAFADCTSLSAVSLPASLNGVGYGAFYHCYALTAIGLTAGNAAYSTMDGALLSADGSRLLFLPQGKSGAYTVPSTVRSVEYNAFADCTALTSVSLPSSLVSIEDSVSAAFSGCTALTSVSVEPGSETFSVSDGALLSADGSSLLYCPQGKSGRYSVPATVRTIEYNAFANCTALTAVDIPNTLVSVGENAFSGCGSLSDVYYDGVETQWNKIEIASGNVPLTSANIHFTGPYGDVNGDGALNALDLALLARYIKAKGFGVQLAESGDLNGDTAINGADLILLARRLKANAGA